MSDDRRAAVRGVLLLNALAILLAIGGLVLLLAGSLTAGVVLVLGGAVALAVRLAKYGRLS